MKREPLKAGEHVIELEEYLVCAEEGGDSQILNATIVESDVHSPGDEVYVYLSQPGGGFDTPAYQAYERAVFSLGLDCACCGVQGIRMGLTYLQFERFGFGAGMLSFHPMEGRTLTKGKCTCTIETLMMAGCRCGGD